MKRLAWAVFLLSNLFVAAADEPKWQGTWAATVGGGPAFAGTWDAVPGTAPNTIAGTWSLRDQYGTELATGTWAAAKDVKVWKGTWQTRRPSGQIYDGVWQAQVELSVTPRLSGLFEAALAKAVSGSWRTGSHGGAWTLRADAQK